MSILKDLKDVLTFAAFRPEPDDSSATWTSRFPNKKTLLINVGKNRTSWRCLGKGGKLADGGVQKGDFKEVATNLAHEWRRLTDEGWCCVSINSRYVISLESNLPRKEGIENTVRTNPRAALGAKYERSKRYALTNNPEHITSIVLACDEEVVKKIETVLAESSLKPGRICCAPYTMLRRAIERMAAGTPPPNAPPANYLYVICCEGSVCLLSQQGDAWTELRSRSDFYDEDPAPVIEMIATGRDLDETGQEVIFSGDHASSAIPEKIHERFPKAKIVDLTQNDHLWATIADLRS